MKRVFIFDIDGCILESIFPNLMPSNQHPEAQEQVVKEVNEKGWDLKLYPEFLRFYYNNCGVRDIIYFVTGRQRYRFERLTHHQLSELHYESIIFYPKGGKYEKKTYLEWKEQRISYLLQGGCEHFIFDDHDEYFDMIDPFERYNVNYFKINNNEGWRKLNETM